MDKAIIDTKRAQAVEYLRQRKIYRGDVSCTHKFEHIVTAPPPRFDVSRDSKVKHYEMV